MEKVTKIEQKHLVKGEAYNPFTCAIALAMKDVGYKRPMVERVYIGYDAHQGNSLRKDITKQLADRIDLLDEVPASIKPFSIVETEHIFDIKR